MSLIIWILAILSVKLKTGVGMTPGNVQELFSIENTKSKRGTLGEKGTGLGLLLCKDFIEKHHGKIWVESKLGKGSRFSFVLPLNPNENKEFN
jgi:signal transduction histidine kinase